METLAPHSLGDVDPGGPEGRAALARMVIRLMDLWQLPLSQQAELLGLSGRGARQTIGRYRAGRPLGPNRDLLDRVGHLLGIHKSLRMLFPHNRDLAYGWMTRPNLRFGGQSPVDVVRDQGFLGLIALRHYLEFERGR
ncbi:MAG: MbcA/ParS/Xre antitoxin family protein [Aquisalimonadaceae bacterium]